MPLASLAVHCKGSTRIAGVARLAVKESNPGATLVGELSKLGCNLKVDKDELVIRGGQVEGGSLSARGDHRIAMAAAATGLAAQGVDTSYPDFFADLESVGTTMS
jgi:3-phosphoshikimate 1-carboxyvinyltransferase